MKKAAVPSILIAVVSLALGVTSDAQQPGKVARIGFLGPTSASSNADRVEALRKGLRDLGYMEGNNLVIEFRWAEGNFDRLPDLAAELVRLNVDVIVTAGTPGARAAKNATTTIPVVMATSGDPVAVGLVASLARPGGNITGSSNFSPELSAKRLELLKEILPRTQRVAVLLNPDNSINVENLNNAAPIGLSENIEAAPRDLIRVAKEFGFEGTVAKRKDSLYESGKRTGAWVKCKVNRGQEFVIGGYTPGNPFDALIVGYYEGERLLYAAKVRNGFVPLVRREVASKFKGLEIDTSPFANLPEKKRTQWALTKEEMKNCVWLKPELVAQIEFTEWTPDGHLRHSKFLGLREDKDAREVVREIEG